MFRLISRISIDGISQSCINIEGSASSCFRDREGKITYDCRKYRKKIDPNVEILQLAPESNETRREVLEQIVPQSQFLDLVFQFVDDFERDFCYPFMTEIDRIEASDGAGARRYSIF